MDATDTLRDAWRSERLVYRGIEADDDKAFINAQIRDDPIRSGLASSAILRPSTKKSAGGMIEFFESCLLAVMICLPAEEKPSDNPVNPTGREPGAATEPKPTPIGFICLFQVGKESNQHHRAARLGISITEPHRSKGYGGEAINWILDWAFRIAGLHRVGLECYSFNPRAERLYRKLGFVEEGREREILFFDRCWHDVILFSMLDREWEKLRGWKPSQAA